METVHEVIGLIKGERVLVAPLNWGLGHATRCVPIINALKEANKEILLAADGVAYDFLQKTFPELDIITLKDMRVRYTQGNSQLWSMIKQTPHFIRAILREHKALKKVIIEHQIDTVIAENRFV